MTMNQPRPNYDRTVSENNGSWIKVAVPPEIAEHLDLKEGSTLRFQEEEGEHGNYASLWNPEQQKKNQKETE